MKAFAKAIPPFLLLFVLALFLSAPAFGAEVTVKGFAFVPKNVEIKAGETVKWTNTGTTMHTITSGANCAKDGAYDSGYLQTKKRKPEKATFERTFDKPGVYNYFCKPHCEGEAMVGTVTVK